MKRHGKLCLRAAGPVPPVHRPGGRPGPDLRPPQRPPRPGGTPLGRRSGRPLLPRGGLRRLPVRHGGGRGAAHLHRPGHRGRRDPFPVPAGRAAAPHLAVLAGADPPSSRLGNKIFKKMQAKDKKTLFFLAKMGYNEIYYTASEKNLRSPGGR